MVFKDPARDSYLLLTLTQDEVAYRFTDHTEEWTTDAGTFEAMPSLEITLPPNTGTFDEKPLAIEFPHGVEDLFDGWVDGSAQAPVTLKVEERTRSRGPINTTACGTQAQKITYGSTYRLVRGVRNPERRAGICRLEFLSYKGLLNVPLGIPATPRCAWTFGDKTCGLAVPEVTATVASVSRKAITLTSPADLLVTTQVAGYWIRGVARKGGLSIGIRDWAAASYTLQLVREPPASWVGAVVTLRPGCVKTVAACTAHGNLERFGGFGIAIPNYHPVLETP